MKLDELGDRGGRTAPRIERDRARDQCTTRVVVRDLRQLERQPLCEPGQMPL